MKNKLSFIQHCRLHSETRFYPALVFGAVLYGLGVGGVVFKTDILIAASVAWAVTFVALLFIVILKTNHWWYEEYDDNKWGRSREVMKELEAVMQQLRELKK